MRLSTRPASGPRAEKQPGLSPYWQRQALLLAAVALFIAAFLISHWVDSLWEQGDDAYITYQYARRLAAGDGFTFSPGALPSYGTTTPLWTFMLAAIARTGVPPHLAAPWLTSFFHAMTAVLVLLVGVAIGGLALGLPAGAMVALSWSVFFRTGGMETALVTALTAALAYVVLGGRSRWWPGVLLGLLLLARIDTGLLVAVLLIGWALSRDDRRQCLIPSLLSAALVCLPWAIYALVTFGDVIPFSLRAKLAFDVAGGMNLRTFQLWFVRGMPAGVFWLSVAMAGVGAVAVWLRRPRFRPFVVWVPVYYLALRLGRAPDFLWYYLPPLWVALLLVVAGAQTVAGALGRSARRPLLAAVSLAVVAGYAYWSYAGIFPLLLPDPNLRLHRTLADRVAALAEPGETVATPEVGYMAYYSGCRILDLRALTCPEVIVRARAHNLGAILRHWKPEFVVLREGGGEPAIRDAYVERGRYPYIGEMDYVIWQRKKLSGRG